MIAVIDHLSSGRSDFHTQNRAQDVRFKGFFTMSSKWEKIDKDTERLSVPGGWIVKVFDMLTYMKPITLEEERYPMISTVFVKDELHEWKIH